MSVEVESNRVKSNRNESGELKYRSCQNRELRGKRICIEKIKAGCAMRAQGATELSAMTAPEDA